MGAAQSVIDEEQRTCPQCGKTITVDKRYVPWCEFCEWNVDPPADDKRSPSQRKRANTARLRGERLFEELRASPVTRPGPSGPRSAAFAISVMVHLLTVIILAFGLYIFITSFLTFFGVVVGGLVIMLAVLVRPQFGAIKSGTVIFPTDGAPALYALTNEIGAQMGAKPVQLIVVDAAFNASHGQVGWRRKRVLRIGLPLWNVLTDSQRVALLAHEIAHQVNGDLAYGTVVGSAVRTLQSWHRTLRPGSWQPGSGSLFAFIETVAQLLARTAYRVLRKAVELVIDLMDSLLYRSGQRTEYFADRVAASAASTDAMVECLDMLHLARPCSLAVLYAARAEEPDIWERERNFVQNFSAKEWERLRRRDAKRGTSIDATHPPTNLRIELLRFGPQLPASLEIPADRSAVIAAEMASDFALVGDRIASGLRT